MSFNLKIIFRLFLLTCFLLAGSHFSPVLAQVKFIPNKGQWQKGFSYKAQLPNGNAFITSNKIWYSFLDGNKVAEIHHQNNTLESQVIKGHSLCLEWLGASKNIVPEAQVFSSEYYNYYLSNNSNNWRSGIKANKKLYYKHFYAGIDMEIEGMDNALKYTYFVEKNAKPEYIKLKIAGAKKLYLKKGNLHIETTVNSILEEAPVAYQTINNIRVEVPCIFVLEKNIISFAFPKGYDKNAELVIDPTVIFATYSGSYADNFGFTATYDKNGNAYAGGTVFGPGFPDTNANPGAFQDTFAGGKDVNLSIGDIERDCGILKFSADGKKLLWASYLGGTHNEQPHSMVVDGNNNLLVFGTTYSRDFPVTIGSYDTSHNGESDIFAVKFSEDGTKLLAGTFVGGTKEDGLNGLIPTGLKNQSPLGYNYGDQFRGEIICDSFNNVYIGTTTYSKDFPVSATAAQKDTGAAQDGIIIKLNSSLSSVIWSTYVGGSGSDAVYSLQLDSQNNVFACGGTTSPYFFADTVTYKHAYSGEVDAFICALSKDGKHFMNTTYMGTDVYEQAYFIQLDKAENVYIYGQTRSNNYPIKNARYVNPKSGQFISKFNKNLDTLQMSSVFGSGRTRPDISPTAFLVDNCGKIYISGWGGEVNATYYGGHGGSTKFMPLTPDAFQKTTDSSDFYLAVFAANMDTILYGSYFGGPKSEEHVDGGTSRFDKKGVIYQSVCAGCGHYSDFPVTPDAYSKINNNSCNNLVFKINLETPDIITAFDTVKPNCNPFTVQFNNKSIRAKTFIWYFGDGDSSTAYNPKHTYDSAGTYTVKLVGTNYFSCSVHDTAVKKLIVIKTSEPTFKAKPKLCTPEVLFEATGYGNTFQWDFGDSTFAKGKSVTHQYKRAGTYQVKLFADTATLCGKKSSQTIHVSFPTSIFLLQNDTCKPIVYFTNYSQNAKKFLWIFEDGTTDTARNPIHDFKKGGIYEARLVAYDSTGCTDTSLNVVNVASEPVASFVATPDACKHKISFKNTSQAASTYLWDFGDGNTSKAKDVVHEYTSAGTYTILLTVNTNTKCPRTFSKTIKITFPTAGFTYTYEACTPLVKFSNKSILSAKYIWNFGDGKTDTSRNTSHYYKTPGIYLVKLLTTDSAGCTDSAFATLQIADTAVAAFETLSDTCSGIIRFQNNSKLANNYLWDFGDGTTDTIQNPTHNYTQRNKEYKVTLIINSPDGCIDSTSQHVYPFAPPTSNFAYTKDSCTSLVQFNSSAYRAQTYFWNFGDGDTSTEANPKHLFKEKGNYKVSLIINANTACADTLEVQLFMPRNELSKPVIYNVITPNGDADNEVFHIENLSQCHEYELTIYNRWGQIIYENKGNKMYWDGTTPKGKAVSEGVYFYVFRDPLYGEQHGTITVIR